ncbi:hypothetical protein M5D96_010075, partial [Drosophila gunungcola]
VLDELTDDIEEDFGPEGYYGKEKVSLRENSLEKRIVISTIFAAVIRIVRTPFGRAIFLDVFIYHGLWEVVESNKTTYEKEIQSAQMLNSSYLRGNLVHNFVNLRNQCDEYVKWHGYGSQEYSHRSRRQATDSCETLREQVMKSIPAAHSSNTTRETLEKQAHSFLQQINCDSPILPDFPKEQLEYIF